MNAVVTAAAREETFNAQRLEAVFGACFAARWRTRLVGGAGEPFYQPARSAGEYHLLHYRLDYFASALHEVAHWCIAGTRRRRLPDFGYWYAPDGREPVQQRAFEAVESRPQALEWFFSRACGYRFRVSNDNLAAGEHDCLPFQRSVLEQARRWRQSGLPQRASVFYKALAEEFGTAAQLRDAPFELEQLQ